MEGNIQVNLDEPINNVLSVKSKIYALNSPGECFTHCRESLVIKIGIISMADITCMICILLYNTLLEDNRNLIIISIYYFYFILPY